MGSELVIAGKFLPSATIDKPIKVTGESRMGPIDYIPIIVRMTFYSLIFGLTNCDFLKI